MALRKIRLGDVVIPYKKKCGNPNLTPYQVSGINKDKEFFEPSNQVGSDTSNYKEVPPGYFACNLMHVGRDVVLPIAYNHTDKIKNVSPAYMIFTLNEDCELLKEYFFMYLKSEEKDRFFWFQTDASVRDGMSWDDFCNVEIEVPDLHIQEKFVQVYQSMVENQKAYERGLEDLKLVCDGYIEDLRRNMHCEEIGKFIKKYDIKNVDGKITLEQGINIDKKFITPQRSNDNFYGRKVVRTGQIAYCTQLNNENVAVALRTGPDCIVSGVYDVIQVIDKNSLIPEYLMLWLTRNEFGRFVYWASQGTSYEFLSYENLAGYKIPVPSKDVQESIAKVYKCYTDRKEINERLKQQIKDICPILIKGSIEESK